MSTEFFEQVADAVVGFVPAELGAVSTRISSINIKVWFGDETREHYEAQFLRDGTFEVGFHAEHRAVERNEAVVDTLLGNERSWRRQLGTVAVAGEFPDSDGWPWRRISEIRPSPRGRDVEAALDVAERLAAYVEALEPVRRRGGA
ncbi:MAG TPA: hypothetical protein VI916_06370 [Acidimicrobiia bacterium]|nr:hypothetical protein [Acidimicrobiia bacterium]